VPQFKLPFKLNSVSVASDNFLYTNIWWWYDDKCCVYYCSTSPSYICLYV